MVERIDEEYNTNEESPDSSWVTPSSSPSVSDKESDDSSTASIDTVLLNFIIDVFGFLLFVSVAGTKRCYKSIANDS